MVRKIGTDGDDGNDTIDGGNDKLFGGEENDAIKGGNGAATIACLNSARSTAAEKGADITDRRLRSSSPYGGVLCPAG